MKKLAWVLLLTLAFNLLNGCGTKEAEKKNEAQQTQTAEEKKYFNLTGYPIVNEPISLTIMGRNNPRSPKFEDMSFFKEMQKITNIIIKFDMINYQAWDEKVNLAFASNELPDVFFKSQIPTNSLENYGKQGLLIPVEKLIKDYAPNLSKIYTDRPGVKNFMTLSDGHIYTFPFISDLEKDKVGAFFQINKKWLDKLSLKVPQTPEELYNTLKAFREKDPNGNGKTDEIPFTSDAGVFKQLFGMYGVHMGGTADSNISVDNTGKVVYHPLTDKYKDLLKYMNKLYAEKLIDNELFIQNKQQIQAKGNATDELLGSFLEMGATTLVGDKRHFDYVGMPPFQVQGVERIWSGKPEGHVGLSMGAITNRNKYPEATVRWLDYLYSEAGGRLMFAGVENVDYKIEADGSWDYINPNKLALLPLSDTISPISGPTVPHLNPVEFVKKQKEAVPIKAHLYKESAKLLPYLKKYYPDVNFSSDNQKKIATLTADINTYVDQMLARFITGDANIDNEWNNYISTLKKMGVDELIKIYQENYKK